MIPQLLRKIAKERIGILLRLAAAAVRTHPERSRRYVELARRIGKKYKVRLPPKAQKTICKVCHSYLRPGVSATVRMDSKNKRVLWKCASCGAERTFGYSEKRAK